jgi:hypothetical protein
MKKRKFMVLTVLPLALLGGVLFLLSPPDQGFATGEPAAPIRTADPAGDIEEDPQSGANWKAPDQEAAKARARETVPFVETVVDECLLCRSQKLRDKGFGVKDITHSYFLLDSPIIKKQEDYYGPVRFMHSKHAATLNDCSVCHHARPTDEKALETTRCSACHQEAFKPDHPERIGLKAAYHLNCIECHKEMNKGPADCIGCHRKNVPDHKELVKLGPDPAPTEVTRECLRCHKAAGEDMLKSVHWLWKGHSPYTMDHRKEVQHGKATTALNNF